jgi:hypothetical protein
MSPYIPEPYTALLMGLGLAGLGAAGKRKTENRGTNASGDDTEKISVAD